MNEKQKTAKSPFDNSRVTFTTEDGKHQSYSCCTICGKWHKGQYGYNLDFHTREMSGGTRVKLCAKCSRHIEGALAQIMAFSWNAKPQPDNSEIGKKCEAVAHMIFDSFEESDE